MVKIDCLWAEDTPLHSHMHPLKHALPSAHHSLHLSPISLHPPPSHFCLPHPTLSPLLFLFHPLSLFLCHSFIPRSLPFAVTVVLPHAESHGFWLAKSDLKRSQDGSQTARAFLITVTQQHNWLSFISHALKACASLSFPPQFFSSRALLTLT